jgi:hypothetical protein
VSVLSLRAMALIVPDLGWSKADAEGGARPPVPQAEGRRIGARHRFASLGLPVGRGVGGGCAHAGRGTAARARQRDPIANTGHDPEGPALGPDPLRKDPTQAR